MVKNKMSSLLNYEKALWEKGIGLIAGVDEAGRGPLAGPIVVAAVILDKNDLVDLEKEKARKEGEQIPSIVNKDNTRNNDLSTGDFANQYHLIKDSKKITEKIRETLYEFIIKKAICYSIVEISVEEIDTKGIGWTNLEGFSRAIQNLRVKPEFILTDHFPVKSVPKTSQENITKGDAISIHIAAASILAKVYRDRIMQEEAKKYPLYGFERHKGYGTKSHIEAIYKHGTCKIHRKSFEPVKSL